MWLSCILKESVTGKLQVPSITTRCEPRPTMLLAAALVGVAGLVFLFSARFFLVTLQEIPQEGKLRRRAEARRRRDAKVAEFLQGEAAGSQGKVHEKSTNRFRNELVLALDQVQASDSALVGGKGAHLGELTRGGLDVPSGFCITSRAFETSKGKVTDALRAAVREHYRLLSRERDGDSAFVAVRSSATCEDGADASYAGQLETILGVQGEKQLFDAILKCWESLQTDRVQAYQAMQAEANSTSKCCVVVQRMVDAECAGVMFTANPLTNALDETVITASWGLGEAVVSDLVEPDTWTIRTTDNHTLTESISKNKSRMHVMDQSSHSGSIIVPVETSLQGKPCLTAAQRARLVELGSKIQALYHAPRDIEWALEKDTGKLKILQARPITSLVNTAEPTVNEFDSPCKPEDWITSCNAQEMFPGAATPLSISTFGRVVNFGMQVLHFAFGVRGPIDETERVVGWWYGCQFLNMTSTLGRMCCGMIGADLAKANGEMSILGRINDKCTLEDLIASRDGKVLPLWRRLINGVRFAFVSLLAIPLRVPRLMARNKRAAEISSKLRNESNPQEMWTHLDDLQMDYVDQWADGIVVSSVSASMSLFVMKFVCLGTQYKMWSTDAVAKVSALISSPESEDAEESCDAVKKIDIISKAFCENATLAEELISIGSDTAGAVAFLFKHSDEFRQLIERHGHRCIKEAEMRTVEWREDPRPLATLIQNTVKMQWKAVKVNRTLASSRMTAPEVLSSTFWLLRGPLRAFAHLARIAIRNRELGKSLCVLHHTYCKAGYRSLGALCAKEKLLNDADSVFFLTHEELGLLCDKRASSKLVASLKLLAVKRRRLYATQDQYRFPDLCQGRPEPVSTVFASSDESSEPQEGTPVCTGVAIGRARVVRTVDEATAIEPGEILVCPQTDVGWTPYFALAGGLVTELGGLLSHGAVVAREYGLPCVVNVNGACSTFKTGQCIELDGSKGTVRVVESI